MKWQEIWQAKGSSQLWSIPDRTVVDLIHSWKTAGDIHRVLDVGCGLGRHAHLLASEGFEVYGSDHSDEAIERCRKHFAEDGLKGEFWCGEFDNIPYEDGYFDAILGFNSIYHGFRKDLSRIAKILSAKTRAGGKGFFTLASQECRLCGTGEKMAPHTYRVGAMFKGLFDHDEEQGELHYFSSEEDVRELFDDYQVDSLAHEELHLASLSPLTKEVKWLRIPQAYFWQLDATKK